MGGRQSRLDRYYASHEKAFDRIETDLRKLQVRLAAARAHAAAALRKPRACASRLDGVRSSTRMRGPCGGGAMGGRPHISCSSFAAGCGAAVPHASGLHATARRPPSQVRMSLAQQRRAAISMWCTVMVVAVTGLACYLIYEVSRRGRAASSDRAEALLGSMRGRGGEGGGGGMRRRARKAQARRARPQGRLQSRQPPSSRASRLAPRASRRSNSGSTPTESTLSA
jgi:hypothetical protein